MGTVASAVLGGVGMIFQGIGQQQADEYSAQKSEEAAQVGKIQADEIDAGSRQDLNTTISNIRAIRASVGGDPGSPSTEAYIDTETAASDRVRQIKVGSALLQSDQDSQDAAFYKSSASSALLGGALASLPKFAGAFSPSTGSGGGSLSPSMAMGTGFGGVY